MVAEVYKLKENSEDKLKALEMAIGQIEKSFGKGSVMKLGQMNLWLILKLFLQDH